jgi:hypothetical protein
MVTIILFLFWFSLLFERLFKFYGQGSLPWLIGNSLAIVGLSVYIILAGISTSHDKNCACVSIGIVFGLWLRNLRKEALV